jgi:hypothetical protein
MGHLLLELFIGYIILHLLLVGHHYHKNSHLPWHKRIWVSVPGPFHTRISRRF